MLQALILLLLPLRLARLLSRRLRARVHPSARVGFSLIRVADVELGSGARIGHFNVIRTPRLCLKKDAHIGHLNRLTGAFVVVIGEHSELGHRNNVTRAPFIPSPAAQLTLGTWSKVTSSHRLDLTCSLSFGDYCTIAGTGSQIWTHGYVHAERGLDRYRIDGPVHIGNNVYVGTMCFISMGVTIADGVIVGGGASVARSLTEPGLYVSAGLRQLPRPAPPEQRSDLERQPMLADGDVVWRKRDVDAAG